MKVVTSGLLHKIAEFLYVCTHTVMNAYRVWLQTDIHKCMCMHAWIYVCPGISGLQVSNTLITSNKFHLSLKKYGCHIANTIHTAITLCWMFIYTQLLYKHVPNTNNCDIYSTYYWHICQQQVCPLKCHTPKFVHVHVCDNIRVEVCPSNATHPNLLMFMYVNNIHVEYELTAILWQYMLHRNCMQSNFVTGNINVIHKFNVTGIGSFTNMPARFHIHVPLNCRLLKYT